MIRDFTLSREPFISIIIPTHNRPEALLRALTAIGAQHYKAKEIVVIVEGRNTETLNILSRAYQQGQPIRWIVHETPQGAMSARAAGLERARGEFVIFHDDDDYFTDPNHLQRVGSMCTDNIVAILSCGSVRSKTGERPFTLGTTGRWNGSDFLRALPSAKVRNPPTTLFTLFRRSTLIESGILKTGCVNDTCIYLHALLHGDVIVLPDQIGVYDTTTTAQGRSLSFSLPANIFFATINQYAATAPLLYPDNAVSAQKWLEWGFFRTYYYYCSKHADQKTLEAAEHWLFKHIQFYKRPYCWLKLRWALIKHVVASIAPSPLTHAWHVLKNWR